MDLQPTQPLTHCVPYYFVGDRKAGGVKLTTHLHPQPRLRGIRSIPLLPLHAFASRRGTNVPSAQAHHLSSSDHLPLFQHSSKVSLRERITKSIIFQFSPSYWLKTSRPRGPTKNPPIGAHCWLAVSIRKVLLWPATSAQVFLGFPLSKSERGDGSPRLKVATACFLCSPPDLNFLDPYFIFMYVHNNHCHRATAHLQLNILLLLLLLLKVCEKHSSVQLIYLSARQEGLS
jgi:hypothetical protein